MIKLWPATRKFAQTPAAAALRRLAGMKPHRPPRTPPMTEDEKRWAREARWGTYGVSELKKEIEQRVNARLDPLITNELVEYTAKRCREMELKQQAAARLDPIPAKPAKG